MYAIWYYDKQKQKYLFIIKVIDKSTKIKSECCRDGELKPGLLIPCVLPNLKSVKVQSL